MTAAFKTVAPKSNLPKRTSKKDRVEMSVQKQSKKSASKSKTFTIQFGSATLKAPSSHDDWERNIGLGQAAMKKMKLELLKPGVRLRTSKSTPLFRADPENPRQLIRILDGKEERGVFEGGVFKVQS